MSWRTSRGVPDRPATIPPACRKTPVCPSRGECNSLIVTLGRRGSMLITAEESQAVPAFPVEAVDTVGAGDCYCGVLAASVAQGLPMTQAMRRASAAAALSTTRRGAQPSMPTRKEIEAFLNRPQEA